MPDSTPAAKPQPDDLVQAILTRRGGAPVNLDKVAIASCGIAA